MNYKKIYADLCLSRMVLKRNKKDGFYENHHYLPKSLGGNDLPQNMVLLTPREHFIAHFLLYKIYKQAGMKKEMYKMSYAFNMMSVYNKDQKRSTYKYNSHSYSVAKEAFRKAVGENNKRRIISEETRQKHRNRIPWCKGKKNIFSEETLKIIGEKSRNRKRPKGWTHSKETREKITKKNYVPVLRFSLDGEYLDCWDSIKEASETLNIDVTGISLACKGKQNTSGGFKWRYKEGRTPPYSLD